MRITIHTSIAGAALLGALSVPMSAQTAPAGTKRALIIAIGDYPVAAGYSKLHVSRDVELVRGALAAQGFDEGAVRVVRDSAATREGILTAFDQLIAQSRPGDAVVIHYSGHGHRITDDNGDELDGFDELLVPYGAPAAVRAGEYRGERHIRDDEVGVILNRLRQRLGRAGSVAVLLDACFSGSGTRGAVDEAAVRGLPDAIIVPGATPPTSRGSDGAGAFLESPATRGSDAGSVAALAPLVVISAARHDQVAREAYDAQRNPVGSLSLALGYVLPKAQAGMTYRALFERIAASMAEMNLGDQSPQLEGAVDAEVFSGRLVAQQPYVRVSKAESDSIVELGSGSLLGLLPGTHIAFHARGTADPATSKSLTTGIVRTATESRAIVALDTRTPPSALRNSWAFVTEYAYGDLRLRIGVDKNVASPVATRLRSLLSAVPLVELVETKPDLRVARASAAVSDAKLAVYGPDDAVMAGGLDPASPAFTGVLDSTVRTLARSAYIRRLDLDSPRLRVRLELVRTAPRLSWSGSTATCSGAAPTPLVAGPDSVAVVLAPQDEYTLRLTNEGSEPAYVVVLDLQPNGRVSQIYPLPEARGSDNFLAPGKSFLVPDICYFAEEPYGLEILKVFATRERVDFTSVLTGATQSARGTLTNPLERLFADAYSGSRGQVVAAAGAATTFSLPITVAPKRPPKRH